MAEVQSHGFVFERWVREQLFDAYEGAYGQEWDVPAENTRRAVALPRPLRGLPVSIKTAKFGSPIGLGDVLRQRRIDEPFLMIAGFWRQRTKTRKWIEEIGVARFSAESWEQLWGGLTLARLSELDAGIKNPDIDYQAARQLAREWKENTRQLETCRLVVNPKIDSKSQRRVQCSLPFDAFWEHVGRQAEPDDRPELFGMPFANPIASRSRTFS